MLIIRPEQFEAFRDVAERAFINEVAEHVREKHSDAIIRLMDGACTVKQIPDETLRELITNGIARARAYGMKWKSSLKAFVVTMFVAAPNFDEHPIIQRILKDEKIEPDNRLDAVWERTSDQNWEAVERNYSAGAWGVKAGEEGK